MYPSVITSFSYPSPTDRLNNPSHSALENTQSSAIGQLQAFIGTQNSVVGTLQYDIRSPLSTGGGHVQTANKGGTGQTTYTKGDLLVAQSSSVLTKLAIGGDGQVLTADSAAQTGISWGAGVTPVIRVYTSSVAQIWTKPSTLAYAIIEVQGNGGNGGNGVSTGGGGGGGGGGGYTRKLITGASLPLAASVLAAGGGVGSILSYFGSILSAVGGQNGSGSGAGNGGGGGLGGSASGGDINVGGNDGAPGSIDANYGGGGNGGGGHLGGGGRGGAGSGVDGAAGNDYGSGGGGGGTAGSGGGGAANGGGGTSGIIIITEF
jgi:hypothetical protein